MKYYGRTSVSEFLNDRVVYRNLVPFDPELPSLQTLREPLGLTPGFTPRKSTMDYAGVMSGILTAAQNAAWPRNPIKRVIFIGDTLLNDSTAFKNICQAGGWPGLAFIGSENDAPLKVVIHENPAGAVMQANRWTALADFEAFCQERSTPVEPGTVVLLDLDKTTLGARGRNDHVINQVRVEAAFQTLSGVLEDRFDPEAFRETYDTFNLTQYHPFTTDNQDYLVYICLVVAGGLYDRRTLASSVERGQLESFEAFLQEVDRNQARLSTKIRKMHRDFFQLVKQGDPTPFKAFRQAEFLATANRMGRLAPGTPVEQMLAEEIVITQEVRSLMLKWCDAGALIFGLSDKPDEASIPTPEMVERGYQPIHRIETSIVGQGRV